MYNELMQRGWRSLRLLALVLIAMPAARAAVEPPIIQKVLTRDYDVQPDGRYTVTIHSELRATNNSAAADIGQIPLGYSDLMQDLEIVEAYTLKPDGQKIMVRPEAIIVQQAPAPQNAPQMDDSRQKVIIYPNVEIGDVLVQDTVTTVKPILVGNYMYDTLFPAALAIDDANITVSAPRATALQIENRILDVARGGDGDRTTLTLHYEHPQVSTVSKGQSSFDTAPRLSLSTFKSYDALAKAYAGEALAAVVSDPGDCCQGRRDHPGREGPARAGAQDLRLDFRACALCGAGIWPWRHHPSQRR